MKNGSFRVHENTSTSMNSNEVFMLNITSVLSSKQCWTKKPRAKSIRRRRLDHAILSNKLHHLQLNIRGTRSKTNNEEKSYAINLLFFLQTSLIYHNVYI